MSLKDLRESRKLTLDQVGKVIGMSGSSYAAYESGKRTFTMDYAVWIAEFFGVNVLDLFCGIGKHSGKWVLCSDDGLPDKDGTYWVTLELKKFECRYAHDITVTTDDGDHVYPCRNTSFCKNECIYRKDAVKTEYITAIAHIADGDFLQEELEELDSVKEAVSFRIAAWMPEPKPCRV